MQVDHLTTSRVIKQIAQLEQPSPFLRLKTHPAVERMMLLSQKRTLSLHCPILQDSRGENGQLPKRTERRDSRGLGGL